MKFLTTTLPDDSGDLGYWLDEVVARGQAARLADELSAVRGTRVGVVEVPADLKEVVARQGFTGLADNQLSIVMADPKLLTALAEAALASEGSFWTRRVGEESTFDGRAERLRAELFATDSVTPAQKAERSRTSFAPWVASLATAAVLLLAFYLVPTIQDVPEIECLIVERQWDLANRYTDEALKRGQNEFQSTRARVARMRGADSAR